MSEEQPPTPQAGIAGVELVALDQLTPDPANLRLHNPRNLKTIAASLTRWGQQKPIVVDPDGVIRAGNGTWLAAKALGWDKILVARSRLTGVEAKAYGIADNRAGELSEFDTDALLEAFDELAPGGEALLEAIGFDAPELDELMSAEDGEPGADSRRLLGKGKHASVACVLPVDDVALVERALLATREANRGKAMMILAESYLAARQLEKLATA